MQRLAALQGLAVRTVACQRVVNVGAADDFGLLRVFSLFLSVVAGPVKVLVVVADEIFHVAKIRVYGKNFVADFCVLLYHRALAFSQSAGLVYDCVGDSNFSYVVQLGSVAQHVDAVLRIAHAASDANAVSCHAVRVSFSVQILGFKRVGKRLYDAHVAFFYFVLQFSVVDFRREESRRDFHHVLVLQAKRLLGLP